MRGCAPATCLPRLARSRFDSPIEPMTPSDMRYNGVRSLYVCWICCDEAVPSSQPDLAARPLSPHLICAGAVALGPAGTRPKEPVGSPPSPPTGNRTSGE
jgi:hypothetical protein